MRSGHGSIRAPSPLRPRDTPISPAIPCSERIEIVAHSVSSPCFSNRRSTPSLGAGGQTFFETPSSHSSRRRKTAYCVRVRWPIISTAVPWRHDTNCKARSASSQSWASANIPNWTRYASQATLPSKSTAFLLSFRLLYGTGWGQGDGDGLRGWSEPCLGRCVVDKLDTTHRAVTTTYSCLPTRVF